MTQINETCQNVIRFGPQPGPQESFLESSADIVIYGGARGGGKSYGLLLEALRNTPNQNFGAVIFRRTMPRVFQEGGLWETSERIFPYAGADSSRSTATWSFPSGSTVSFDSMENVDDRFKHLGSQIPLIGFDQLEEFTASQFWFMLGSNRSTCGVKPYIRATANPEPGWLADLIQWWWDPETGYSIPERSGVIRWFVQVKDKIMWADTREELESEFASEGVVAKSFTFIPAYVDDNKILLEADPGYKSNLLNMGTVDRERYLKGNWKIRISGGNLFNRGWFPVQKDRPAHFERMMRYWDFAATGEETANKNTCYTGGVLLGLEKGQWYICDVRRIRGTPKQVEELVAQCAATDPRFTEIRIEQEPGSGGKNTISHYQRNILTGYDCKEGSVMSRKDKITRAKPVSSAAEARNVILIAGAWNSDFLSDCDTAPDGFMDTIDALSGAFNEMNPAKSGPSVKPRVDTVNDMYRIASPSRRGILC